MGLSSSDTELSSLSQFAEQPDAHWLQPPSISERLTSSTIVVNPDLMFLKSTRPPDWKAKRSLITSVSSQMEVGDRDMFYVEHGGDCCGVSHVVGFPPRPDKDGLREFNGACEDAINDICNSQEDEVDPDNFGHLLEAVLTDFQMTQWSKELHKQGWKLQRRWLNSNSSNFCNLLTWVTPSADDDLKHLPYEWPSDAQCDTCKRSDGNVGREPYCHVCSPDVGET